MADVCKKSRSAPPNLFWNSPTVIKVLPGKQSQNITLHTIPLTFSTFSCQIIFKLFNLFNEP